MNKRQLLEKVEIALRPYIKRTLYKRLYGGDIGPLDCAIIRGYRYLPNAHPLARATLEAPLTAPELALWRRRALLVAGVAIVALMTYGCAAPGEFEPQMGWEATPSHKPLPPIYFYTTASTIQAACGNRSTTWVYHGCAIRTPSANECLILVEPNPPQWLREHEEKHCAGYDHRRQ